MPSRNLRKRKQMEKPVAKVDEKVPDNVRKEKAMEDSDDISGKDEQELKVKNKSKKKKSPQISLKRRAMEDSGDINEQGEKGETVQKKSKKMDSPQISEKNKDANDKCSLFIKPIKKTDMREEISNLSKDILAVKFKPFRKSTKETPLLYAILVFADEATAEKNYKLLQGKKCGDENLIVDYVGEKSMNKEKEKEKVKEKPKAEEVDKSRLFVRGFKSRPTESELRKLFPKSQKINIPAVRPRSKSLGYAFIGYADENLAEEAFESMQKSSLVVTYFKAPKPEKRKAPKQKGSPPKRKVKGKPQPNLDDDEKEDEDSDAEEDD